MFFLGTGKFSEEVLQSYDDSRRLFVCRHCGTERKRSDRLALHLQWHEDHPEENYQTRNNCKICGRFNATYFMLKMHMTRMHTDMPKTFHCMHEGCGKSFRMQGVKSPATQRGIIPRSFEHIFEVIDSSENMKYLVHAAYLEIYNEEIRDLLGSDSKKKLDLKEKNCVRILESRR